MGRFLAIETRGASLRSTLQTAVFYLVSAKLALLLAIPPGYSSPIWPAAGIALASTLILGRAALPGVLLGSFFANLNPTSFGLELGTISPLQVAVAFVIACGAAFQAWVGSRLLFADPGFSQELLREKDFLRVFTHGGLLACLCNALIGSLTLASAQLIAWNDFIFTSFTWWVGDLIGVLSFTPLCLLLFSPARPKPKQGFDPFLAIVLGGFALTVAVFSYVRRLEEERTRLDFQSEAIALVAQIEDSFQAYESALLAFEAFFRSSDDVSRAEFHSFSEGFFPTLPGLFGLSWTPRLRYEEIGAFESRARAEGLKDYQVHHIVSGEKTPVSRGQAYYYPVFFFEPPDERSLALGFDVASEASRMQAQVRAALSSKPTATPPLRLLNGSLGIVIATPVYAAGPRSGRPPDESLRGFVHGVFKMDDFMQRVLTKIGPQKLEFVFGSPEASRRENLFTSGRDSEKLQRAWLAAQPEGNANFVRSLSFELGGQSYRLLAFLDNSALSKSRSWSTWLVLVGGTLFSGLLGIAISIVTSRSRQTEALIEKRTSELQASNRELAKATLIKSQFLANMSHEIRTPLNGIVGNAGLLLQERDAAARARYASSIVLCSQMLTAIINDILDFSKIEAGKLQLEKAPFSLTALVEAIEKMMQAQVEAKGLSLSLVLEGPIVDALEGDSLRIQQIILNLLSNALKFTEKGSIELKFWQEQGEAERLRLHGSVRDSGIGMSAAEQARLFHDFSQVDTSTTRRFGGTGLGLVISKQLCELMGGSISVESSPGKGSTFRFTLELGRAGAQLADNSAVAIDSDPFDEDFAASHPLKILVAEDNFVNQVIIRSYLRKFGYEASLFEDGAAALSAALSEDFDLLILDMQMPELDGPTVAARVRRELPAHCQPYIVALTASVMAAERQACIEAGMDDFLGKPLLAHNLRTTLEKVSSVRVQRRPAIRSLSWRGLAPRFAGDFGLFVAVAEAFLRDRSKLLEAVRAASAAGDAGAIGASCHKLVGALSSLAPEELSQLAREMEDRARRGELPRVRELLPRLEAELADFAVALEKIVFQQSA